MINLRQQTVNVDRLALIEALKDGLKLHRAQYAEAATDYKAAVLAFQIDALKRAQSGDLKDLNSKLIAPVNKEDDYLDVIEMMIFSVDEVIQIDKEAFKAFYKNEWPWTSGFLASANLYKSALGAMAS